MEIKLLVPLVALALLFGCVMEMSIDQTVNKDGSAKVIQTMDMSKFIDYIKGMSLGASQYATLPKPDSTYSADYYASIPSFESEGLELNLDFESSPGAQSEDQYPGKSVMLYGSIKNSGNGEISNVSIEVKSRALVRGSLGNMQEFVPRLEVRRTESLSLSGKIANVTPGNYGATIIATYDTPARKGVQAARAIYFKVVSAEQQLESSLAKMDAQFQKSCTDIMKADASLQCNYQNSKLEISKTIQPGQEDYSFKREDGLLETAYNVTITAPPQLSNYTPSDSSYGSLAGAGSLGTQKRKFKDGFGSGAEAASLSMARSVLKMTYTVHMPGKIASAPGGTISADNSSVSYDVLELYDKKQDISVLSKEESAGGQFTLLVGAIILALVVFGVIYLIYKRGQNY